MNPDLIARLAKLEKAATAGPWGMDQHDQRDADSVYVSVHGPTGKVLFDTVNSEVITVHDDSDEDGPHYWDEVGKANLKFVAEMRNHAADLLEVARLAGHASELQRDLIADLSKQNEKLRKIAACVPEGVYAEAQDLYERAYRKA